KLLKLSSQSFLIHQCTQIHHAGAGIFMFAAKLLRHYQRLSHQVPSCGRSAPSVVACACPGHTTAASGEISKRRSATSLYQGTKPPRESLLPTPPGKSESPTKSCGTPSRFTASAAPPGV